MISFHKDNNSLIFLFILKCYLQICRNIYSIAVTLYLFICENQKSGNHFVCCFVTSLILLNFFFYHVSIFFFFLFTSNSHQTITLATIVSPSKTSSTEPSKLFFISIYAIILLPPEPRFKFRY